MMQSDPFYAQLCKVMPVIYKKTLIQVCLQLELANNELNGRGPDVSKVAEVNSLSLK